MKKLYDSLLITIGLGFYIASAMLNADESTIDPLPPPCCETDCGCGIWLPEDSILFRPFVADPHVLALSAGWRFNDQVLVKNVIDVSYYDNLAIYRWCNAWPWGGQLQVELEGALWACFDPLHDSAPLMNADYYVGIPITYAIGRWSFRLRGYHISSHVGDEFLLNHLHADSHHPGVLYQEFDRRNPSAEYLDFYASYYPTDDIRVYGGIGFIIAQDRSFPFGRFYAEAGLELHLTELGFINECQQIFGRPFFGMDFRYQTKFDKHINQTYVLGYEFGKLCGLQRLLRFYIQYHDGYSYEGQFCRFPTNYFSIRASYGFYGFVPNVIELKYFLPLRH